MENACIEQCIEFTFSMQAALQHPPLLLPEVKQAKLPRLDVT